jgi:pectin methylesterase-like acyl-CoA thioesterase
MLMKSAVKPVLSAMLCGLYPLVSIGTLVAQPTTATWPLTNPAGTPAGTGLNVLVAGPVTGFNEKLRGMEINQYTGPNSSQRVRMAGTGNTWPANQTTQIDTVYTQFSVSPKSFFTLKVDSVVLSLGAASTNYMKANLWYSKDSTFATKTAVPYVTSSTTAPAGTFLTSGALDVIRFSPAMDLAEGEQFYFRVYPWVDNQGTAPSGKYACPQNVNIYGTATSLPIPAEVTWTMNGIITPTVSGLLSASNQRVSDSTEMYGYTTVNSVKCGWVVTKNHVWTARLSRDPNVYVQYEVGPHIGGTFHIDSIAMSLGAAFTNNIKATALYSRDSTFATFTQLLDTVMVASTLVPYTVAVNDTIESGNKGYVRIYPYNLATEGWAKLMYVSNIRIVGNTTGLAILSPTVSTSAVGDISTTFATSGGNVSADGGGTVFARGVCWDTVTAPLFTGSHSTDGGGVGVFTSSLTGLLPGKKYYVRAYAANVGGTAYGNEVSFSTLAAVVPPTVTTTAASTIMVKTAIGGGNVTAWGGADVTARGICWNTTGTPTTVDLKTVDGTGTGTYTSGMTGLTAGTKYFVRAYAINTAGTGYGDTISFTAQIPARDTTVVVAKDGSGDYLTVQEAFRAVPVNYTGKWTIFVKKGIYHEKDTLAANKPNVVLVGEDRDSTVIWNDDYGDKYGSGNPGTSGTFTVTIEASDFVAKNLTIQNTYAPQAGVSGTQAVALRVNGDRQEYINCRLLGYQDTYYTWGGSGTGRTWHKNCYIEGTVDFIFGRNIVVFDSCTIRALRNGGTLTAASTDASSLFGYVFRNCTIVADSIGYDGNAIASFYLGRPWQASPRTVFIRSNEPKNLHTAGWLAWNVTPGLYAEYNCFGPGAATTGRVTWSSQLGGSAASTYSLTTIFAKNSATSPLIAYDWKPTNATAADELPFTVTSVEPNSLADLVPARLTLVNYPNPFNPETNIRFSVATDGRAVVRVFNLLGQEVALAYDGFARAGEWYNAKFVGANFSTGVYYCTVESNNQRQVQRMLMLK